MQQHRTWPEPQGLASLVREAQRGSDRALEALLTALRPALVAFFASRLSRDAAEDLAQYALVRIAGALRRIDPERADAYVSTVARNLLRTAYRRRAIERRRHVPLELAELVTSSDAIDLDSEYQELVRAVHRVAREGLPTSLSDVVLSLLRGETTSEIAERLAVSPVTVRTRLLRARALLRRDLRGYLDSGLRLGTEPATEQASPG